MTEWEQEATERDIALEVEGTDALPSIRVDQANLRRVMNNLVKNALEAIDRRPGMVRISVESHEQGRRPDRRR